MQVYATLVNIMISSWERNRSISPFCAATPEIPFDNAFLCDGPPNNATQEPEPGVRVTQPHTNVLQEAPADG